MSLDCSIVILACASLMVSIKLVIQYSVVLISPPIKRSLMFCGNSEEEIVITLKREGEACNLIVSLNLWFSLISDICSILSKSVHHSGVTISSLNGIFECGCGTICSLEAIKFLIWSEVVLAL